MNGDVCQEHHGASLSSTANLGSGKCEKGLFSTLSSDGHNMLTGGRNKGPDLSYGH